MTRYIRERCNSHQQGEKNYTRESQEESKEPREKEDMDHMFGNEDVTWYV